MLARRPDRFVYENADEGARMHVPSTSLMKPWNQQRPREVLHAGVSAGVSAKRSGSAFVKGVNASVIEVRKITHLRSPEDLWGLDEDDPLHEDMNEIG
jgi:hypothetical protein